MKNQTEQKFGKPNRNHANKKATTTEIIQIRKQ